MNEALFFPVFFPKGHSWQSLLRIEIPGSGPGTALLGVPGASYVLSAITVIEYPATTIGIDLVGDPTGWTAELWGTEFPGDGTTQSGLLDSRPLEDAEGEVSCEIGTSIAYHFSYEDGFSLSGSFGVRFLRSLRGFAS